jgi:predicted cobalt transporter CbtA
MRAIQDIVFSNQLATIGFAIVVAGVKELKARSLTIVKWE